MTEQSTIAQPTWQGTKAQQELAQRVFDVMMMQGSFYAENMPIRQTLANLAAFFAAQDTTDEAKISAAIDAAVQANANVFDRTVGDDNVIAYATTRLGYFTEPQLDTRHTFAKRLHEPETLLPLDDLSSVITRTRPALTTIEPVYISEYWQLRSPMLPESGDAPAMPVIRDMAPAAQPVQPKIEETVVESSAPVASKPAESRGHASVNSTTMMLDDGTAVDLSQSVDEILLQHGEQLQTILSNAILNDPLRRIVAFGNEFYPEDGIPTLSKGDLRRIREYVVEQGEPMPDTSILSDVYYKNPRDHDFTAFKFALNYRLNREKDFEFVGVQGANLWSAKGLPTVGTKRLKTSELGQFFAFLEEDPAFDDSLKDTSTDDIKNSRQISRFLTFFEWEYGILPFDAAMKALFPLPVLPEQRTAILRIESPQHYTFHLAELRYPTANRGGWLHGLEEFFKEHLIPGALITLTATDDPSVWTLQYEETGGEETKLLQQDDKKNRFAFAKYTYYCDADADLIPSQDRMTRLKNMRLLAPGERRRLTSTAGYVLEQVGQPRPGERAGFQMSIEDLFLATNVQRPATRAYLRLGLADEQDFLVDDDTFIYFPPAEEDVHVVEEVSDDEE